MSKRTGYFALILRTAERQHHVTMEPREDGMVEVTTFTSAGPRYSAMDTTVVSRDKAREMWAIFRRNGFGPGLPERDGTRAEREAAQAKRAEWDKRDAAKRAA